MKLKALIFDVDGTLADTEEAHRAAFNQAFTEQGLSWHWSRSLYKTLLKTTGGKERIAAHLNSLALPPAEAAALKTQIPELHRRKTAIYTELVAQGKAPLRNGVERLLDEAAAYDVTLGIATTTSFENVRSLLETTLGPDSLRRFQYIGAGDAVAHKKPASDVYELVLKHLGIPRDRCVAVEDSVNGLIASRGAGLFTLATPSYWTQDEDLSSADLLVPHLGSVTVPLPDDAASRIGRSVVGIPEIDACLTHAPWRAQAQANAAGGHPCHPGCADHCRRTDGGR